MGKLIQGFLALVHPSVGGRTGKRFDSTHTGRHARLGDDFKQPHLSGMAEVSPATELQAESGNLYHTDAVAILLAKQRHRPARLRLLDRNVLVNGDRRILKDAPVHYLLYASNLVG